VKTFDFTAGQPPSAGGTYTFVQGRSFVICGPGGDISGGVQGLFVGDTRIGSDLAVTLDGEAVESLAAWAEEPFHGRFVGRTQEPHLLLFRDYWLGAGLRADIRLHNPTPEARSATLAIHVGSDLADLFDVKGNRTVRPPRPGVPAADGLGFGDPSALRSARIRSHPVPEMVEPGVMRWSIELEPHDDWTCCVEWVSVRGGTEVALEQPCGVAPSTARPSRQQAGWREHRPILRSDVLGLERIYERTVEDLGALRMLDEGVVGGPVLAAGAPWFMTLFGRDSLIASWMALLIDPALGLATADVLARLQGTSTVIGSEEEPGRILHEVRVGRTSSLALIDGEIYYGTCDATPLFVMLVHELWRWGVPLDDLQPLVPHVDAALAWMAGPGDPDGDGYLEYQRTTEHGLENQGWKDSYDAIHFADGSLARAPIALCEVQGYAYAAWLAGAALARATGDQVLAARRADRAEALRVAFNRDYWLPDRAAFAIALDGDKRPVDSIASNMGHCLWTGIVDPEHAAAVARWLTDPHMASGWGLRTLSTSMARYDPLSYHNGSVWPHDTAIAVAGLRRAGFPAEALWLAEQLLAAAVALGGRLPELFSGLTPADLPGPVPYPTSCSPQAWASAAPLLVVRALLGFEPDVPSGRLAIDPLLPAGASRLRLDGIVLGTTTIGVEIERDGVAIRGLPKGFTILRTAS
jgi:glycogen debranching enzyme